MNKVGLISEGLNRVNESVKQNGKVKSAMNKFFKKFEKEIEEYFAYVRIMGQKWVMYALEPEGGFMDVSYIKSHFKELMFSIPCSFRNADGDLEEGAIVFNYEMFKKRQFTYEKFNYGQGGEDSTELEAPEDLIPCIIDSNNAADIEYDLIRLRSAFEKAGHSLDELRK